mgnify:CR=1 FL=1
MSLQQGIKPELVFKLQSEFRQCRAQTLNIISGLTAEDMMMQSMPDASPTKWHLAHTTWFFEQFILVNYLADYQLFDTQFNYLFNSYYNQIGERHVRAQRSLLSRPSLEQVLEYRRYVENRVQALFEQIVKLEEHKALDSILKLIELGIHHEMQHQELILTDILHAFSLNSVNPNLLENIQKALQASTQVPESVTGVTNINAVKTRDTQYLSFNPELTLCGANPNSGFSFDCERPRHQVFIQPFKLACQPVTNAQWIEFIENAGYDNPDHWLSDGWSACQAQKWQAPLYWRKHNQTWHEFTLDGLKPLNLNAPVCHISYFEADAFASWAGARLPTEFEWEAAAGHYPIEGPFLETFYWQPQPLHSSQSTQHKLNDLYGNIWQWTSSAFSAYPEFKKSSGAVGEYNGKFMSGQYVLRGGSCVTPVNQIRASYRNFFYPQQRWQFSGLRLAKD